MQLVNTIKEWVKALVYALITVLIIKVFFFEIYTIPTSSMEKTLLPGDLILVNKISFGARIPFTNYKILAISNVNRGDVIVFNYPMDENSLIANKSLYIKRCVAVPGDTLQIKNKLVFINNKQQTFPTNAEFNFNVITNKNINQDTLQRYNITEGGRNTLLNDWQLTMTEKTKERLAKQSYISNIKAVQVAPNTFADYIFPYHPFYQWNIDYFGKLVIPKKGVTVKLDSNNIYLYKRIIRNYEHNNFQQYKNIFVLNGDTTNTYTFKMDYYFMMGDNRHNSSDSRFWGFVPENHIVGKAKYVIFSINRFPGKEKSYRWDRIFKKIN